MSGIENFLRTYEFLNLTKSVTEAQMALYKEPNQTWSQIGSKFYNICWYNGKSIAAVGFDVAIYLAVSTLRSVGLFCSPPSQPPLFPIPHDNVQFLRYAIERALFDWDPSARKEFEEEIESSFSDQWNVFQVVGEWSIAYSLENTAKSRYYKPTFLTISEPLESGASFVSVGKDFAKLWAQEQKAILNALYHQSKMPSLSRRAKKVYQDIRALASKLHQGNQNYLLAFGEYVKKRDTFPAPIVNGSARPRTPIVPSAPPLSQRNFEIEMAENVAFLRYSLIDLPSSKNSWLRSQIMIDRGQAFPGQVPKQLLASLAVLRGFKEAFKEKKNNTFSLLPWNESLKNGKPFRAAGQNFADLTDQEFVKLRDAIVDSRSHYGLSERLKVRLNEVNEFGENLARSDDFKNTYDALKIDLLLP